MLIQTLAGTLKTDPKVAEAKKILLDAVTEHQKAITGIRPPNPELKEPYEQAVATLSEHRGFDLWLPYIGSGIGRGPLVELLDGSVKYDLIGGIGVQHFGHSHHDIISACIDAAISDIVMQGNLQQNGDSAELMDMLIKESKLNHCFLTTSGSMANENALKMAFQKHHPANRILAFEHCFSGRTLLMANITDRAAFREGLPRSTPVDYVPFFHASHPEESTKRAVTVLKTHIARYPKKHAAMMFELVQGEGGFYPGTTEYFKALMQVLKDNNIAVFVDEIQTFGRTTRMFAYQHFGLDEYVDIVTIGKLAQICATLFTNEYKPRPGLLSQTFTGSTSTIHAAKTIIHLLLRDGYFGPEGINIQIHNHFSKKLKELSEKHPKLIRGPFGIGAMIAFTPLNGEFERVKEFVHKLYDNGVIAFIAGSNPTRARFLVPAGAVSPDHVEEILKVVEETLLCM